MCLHSAIRWPEVYDTTYWPYALSYACHIYNQLPKKSSGMSPQEIWQGVKEDHTVNLGALLPWGCPTYVLAAKLQDGQKLPKWKPRSRRGQFLGVSEFHCQQSVSLVRNLVSQRISPQFHVVHDAFFTTVHATEAKPPDNWTDLLIHSRYQCPTDHDEEGHPGNSLDDEWLDETEKREWAFQRELQSRGSKPPAQKKKESAPDWTGVTDPVKIIQVNNDEPSVKMEKDTASVPEEGRRRSTRDRQAPAVLNYDKLGGYAEALLSKPNGAPVEALYLNAFMFTDPDAGLIDKFLMDGWNELWSLISKKKGQDPDNPNWAQAMAGPHQDKFIETKKEI